MDVLGVLALRSKCCHGPNRVGKAGSSYHDGATEALADAMFREVSAHAVTHTRAFVLRAAPLVESLRQLAFRGDCRQVDDVTFVVIKVAGARA